MCHRRFLWWRLQLSSPQWRSSCLFLLYMEHGLSNEQVDKVGSVGPPWGGRPPGTTHRVADYCLVEELVVLLFGGNGVLWVGAVGSTRPLCTMRRLASRHPQSSKEWSLGSACVWQWVSQCWVASCQMLVGQQILWACAFWYLLGSGCWYKGADFQVLSRAVTMGMGEQSY
jgi:hypothetical protein